MLLLKKLFNWLLPYTCILCRNTANRTQDICQPCLDSLPFYPNGCALCARIIPYSTEKLICGICLQQTPPYSATFALFVYHAPVTKLILDLKFQNALMNAQLLGELLAEKISQQWYQQQPLPEVIIPMPLHTKRLQERGFNQALELAKPISKALRIPILLDMCQRVKPTLAQATLTAELRQKNLRDAFWIAPNIQQKHIAVVDDVITTGSTITEFCYELKQQGVERIDVWCCARANLVNTISTAKVP